MQERGRKQAGQMKQAEAPVCQMPFKLFLVLFFEKDVVTPTVTMISARSLL